MAAIQPRNVVPSSFVLLVAAIALSGLGAARVSGLPATHPVAGASSDVPVLVTADWLAARLADDEVRVLYVGMGHDGPPAEFIPGAGFLDYHTITARQRNGLITEMPPLEDLIEVLRAAGISSDTHVVLYGNPQHRPARAFVVLEYLGHARVSVLDGGLRAWKAESRPLVTTATVAAVGTLEPRLRDDVLVDREWIRTRLEDPSVTLIDARPAAEFTGSRAGQAARGGHIPGAHNIYWEDLLEAETMPRLMDLDAVRARYEAAGARPEGIVVSYCYIGMRASYTYLISRHLGFASRFYDGSWNDWSQAGLPAETGSGR